MPATPTKSPDATSKSIQKGLDFLRNLQDPDGAFPFDDSGNAGMYAHAIATMAVCEALGLTNDPDAQENRQERHRLHHLRPER